MLSRYPHVSMFTASGSSRRLVLAAERIPRPQQRLKGTGHRQPGTFHRKCWGIFGGKLSSGIAKPMWLVDFRGFHGDLMGLNGH